MVELTWSTAADWDSAAAEQNTVHESFGDLPGDGTVTLGYPSFDRGGSALEHYYPLDEDSGSTAADATGTTDGTTTGATVGQPGLLGTTCYDFDGSGDYVEFGEPTISGEITVVCWANVDQIGATASNEKIVAGPYDNTVPATAWELKTPSDGTLQFATFDGSAHGATADISGLSNTAWHLVGGRYDGSQWDVIVNGSIATSSTTGDQSVGPQPSAGGLRTIGGQYKTGASEVRDFCTGRIEAVRIYSRSLSEAEIQALYDTPTAGSLTTSGKVS